MAHQWRTRKYIADGAVAQGHGGAMRGAKNCGGVPLAQSVPVEIVALWRWRISKKKVVCPALVIGSNIPGSIQNERFKDILSEESHYTYQHI